MNKRNPEIVEIIGPLLSKIGQHFYMGAQIHIEPPAFISLDPYITEEIYKAAEEIYQLAWEDGHRHNWEE